MPSPLDMPKLRLSPDALKQIDELLGTDWPQVENPDQPHPGAPCDMCHPSMQPKPEPIENKTPYVRKPHLTERPLKNHTGLADLKASLIRNETAQEV